MLKIGHEVKHPGKRAGDPQVTVRVAEELETVPGIPSNLREVDWYAREYPLDTLKITEGPSEEWSNIFREHDPEIREIRKEHGRLSKPIVRDCLASGHLDPTGNPTGEDVSQLIKDKARELGLLEVGITAYDHRYTYKSRKDIVRFEHAICVSYEQEFHATQTIPSVPGEMVHSSTYRVGQSAVLALADYIRSLGYHAEVDTSNDASSAYIPMFVAAGLGQLGACGYLLTPYAGNRQRLFMMTTDAPANLRQAGGLRHSRLLPGLPGMCQPLPRPGPDAGQGVVERNRKNKLYFKRCRPVMARYMGCAICMKVCPVQKYGMVEVLNHYAETGQVLGKGTHDLEGYTLPDRDYFGPGEMPVFDASFFDMPHGSSEDWALEQLRRHYAEAGNTLTDEMMEEFKKEIARALSAAKGPILEKTAQEGPDYV